MKIILFINFLLSLNCTIKKHMELMATSVYKYQEMKEVRYLYFYNVENFDINSIEVLIADKSIPFVYEYVGYYKIDLENYYPLSSINVKINADFSSFSLNISNKDDFSIEPFAYIKSYNEKNININNLTLVAPEWGGIKYTYKKPSNTKSIKVLE